MSYSKKTKTAPRASPTALVAATMLSCNQLCPARPCQRDRRKQTACRRLFGLVNHTETKAVYERELRVVQERNKQKWNYDFVRDVPLKGKFAWEIPKQKCDAKRTGPPETWSPCSTRSPAKRKLQRDSNTENLRSPAKKTLKFSLDAENICPAGLFTEKKNLTVDACRSPSKLSNVLNRHVQRPLGAAMVCSVQESNVESKQSHITGRDDVRTLAL